MKNSRVTLNFLDRYDHVPVGYKEITCHFIFDVKMDLTRKAGYAAGGNLTNPPLSTAYASVASLDSVRLAFFIAVLNDLDILSGDIQKSYLNARTKEKVYLYAGGEWKYYQGKLVIIVRSLYGLKSSALAWRNHISEIPSNHLGFQSYLADPDIWFKPTTDKTGEEYYTYILVYDDYLFIVDK